MHGRIIVIWVAVFFTAMLSVGYARAEDTAKVTVSAVPNWVVPVVPPATRSGDGAIEFRLMDIQSRIDETGLHQYFHQLARVVTPEGLPALGNFGVAWQPQISTARVHILKIRRGSDVIDLLKDGGAFQVLRREANLEKLQMDGALTAVMPIADLRVGDELEIAWSLDVQNSVLGGLNENRQQFSAGPTFGRFFMRSSWPKARRVGWKVGTALALPKLQTGAGSDNGFVIDRTDYAIPAIPDGAPARFAQATFVEISEFADWGVVVDTMLPLYAKASKISAGSSIAAEIARIAGVSPDPRVRATEALKSVQGNIRYFARFDGLGGYVPEHADAVWVARSGDCKGKTALLLALLRGLGIEADAALVSSSNGDGLDARLPMPAQFDHVIVRAIVSGKTYWLDGTRLGDRSVDTISVPRFTWALPIRSGSRALVPLIATDPILSEAEWRLDLDARGGIDKPAKARGLVIFRGDRASAVRTAMSLIPPSGRDEFLRKTWLDRHYWIKPDQTTYAYDEKVGEVRLSMTGTGEMDWNNKDGESYNNYEADKSTMGQNVTWKRAEALQDAAPIYVAPRFDVFHETILLPGDGKGFRLEATPIEATIACIRYTRTHSLIGDRFEMTAITRSGEGELRYADAVAADKATDVLSNKRVFIYLPSNASAAQIAPRFKSRTAVAMPILVGKAARAEFVSGAISDDDYPKDAVRDGISGTTTVIFDVGADGRVKDCGIGQSSGSALLDDQSCALVIERFTFNPARAANGSRTSETRTQRITWRLPDGAAFWVEPYTATMRFTLGKDGVGRDCTVTGTPQPPQPTTEDCAKFGNSVAVKDKSGNPIVVRVTETHARTVEPVAVPESPLLPSSGNPR